VRLAHRGIYHLADSYNIALEMARGDYVAILEGDDFWPATKLERQIATFADPDVVLSWGIVGVANAAGELMWTAPSKREVRRMQGRTPGEALLQLLKGNYIPSSTVVCRRQALLAVGGFQQPTGMPTTDYPTWLELCRVGTFEPVSELLGYHRKHDAQVTTLLPAEMDKALEWGTTFVGRLSPSELESLGLRETSLRRVRRQNRGAYDYAAGRVALRQRRQPAARALFRMSIRRGGSSTRIKAAIGLVSSYVGLDLDRITSAWQKVGR
jgi:hypothetical protein